MLSMKPSPISFVVSVVYCFATITLGHRDSMDDMVLEVRELNDELWTCINDSSKSKYDRGVVDKLIQSEPKRDVNVNKTTIVFVIDMQNDFVSGSLGQPCNSKRVQLANSIKEIINKSHQAGAVIIASLDYHPETHCSFRGNDNCTNEFHFTEDTARYKNEFNPHTVYENHGGNTRFKKTAATGNEQEYYGAAFSDKIRVALHEAALSSRPKHPVYEVFKGFSTWKDSFAAFPHPNKDNAQKLEEFTGGFLVNRDVTEGTKAMCFERPEQDKSCFPTVNQLEKPNKRMYGVVQLISALQNKGRVFTQILLTGLVFDYCVKETAMAIKKWNNALHVNIVVEAARPAMEGAEGEGDHEKTLMDLKSVGVGLVSKDWLSYTR